MFSGLKFRVFLSLFIVILLFLSAGFIAVRKMDGIKRDLSLIHKGYFSLSRHSNALKSQIADQNSYLEKALKEKDYDVRNRLISHAKSYYPNLIQQRLNLLEKTLAVMYKFDEDKADRKDLQEIIDYLKIVSQSYEVYQQNRDHFIKLYNELSSDEIDTLFEDFKVENTTLLKKTSSLNLKMESKLGLVVLNAEQQEKSIIQLFLSLFLFATCLSFLVAFMIHRGLSPLSELLHSVKSVGRGVYPQFEQRKGPSEIADLFSEFKNLTDSLKEREEHNLKQKKDVELLKSLSENVLRSVHVGIFVIEKNNCVSSINDAARSIFGLSMRNIEGETLENILNISVPEYAEQENIHSLMQLMVAVEEVRESRQDRHFPLSKIKDRFVDISLVPVREANHYKSELILLIGDDVTHREKTKRQLLENKGLASIGQLAAQITHEIRNPLSSIGLNIELLSDDIPFLPEERQEEAEHILSAVLSEVDRLRQITEGYLHFARLPTATKKEGDLGSLLADIAAFSHMETQQRGIMLELQVSPDLPTIQFDRLRLRQAILNLLHNAEDAAGEGGSVRLSLKEIKSIEDNVVENQLMIGIEDTGGGIEKNLRDKVFESFYTTKNGGTGLGLSLTKEVVEEHRAEIRITDSELGGAFFQIILTV